MYRDLIDQGNRMWQRAFEAADPVAFSEVFDEDGSLLSSNGDIVRGKAAIRDRIAKFMESQGPMHVDIDTQGIWESDGFVYESGLYAYREYGESTILSEGTYVVIWKPQKNGGLKIWKDIGVEWKK